VKPRLIVLEACHRLALSEGQKENKSKEERTKMLRKKIAAFFFIMTIAAMLFAMRLPLGKAWFGDTDYSCPPFDTAGWYCQCHHRSPNFGSNDDCWVATGVETFYHWDLPPAYLYVYWSWCSSVGNPSNWQHNGATSCLASVNLDNMNVYYDSADPEWQWIYDVYGYTRLYTYMSSAFDPEVYPVYSGQGSTGQIFYNINTWDYYFISSTTEPWDALTAHEY
jgi:hypothetical protein